MHKSIALLASPLITIGLVYWLGIGVIAGCFGVALCALLLSTGDSNTVAASDSTQSLFGEPTTFIGGL